jgi:hypothetical protein
MMSVSISSDNDSKADINDRPQDMLESYKRNLSVGFSTQDHFTSSKIDGVNTSVHTVRSGSFPFADLMSFLANQKSPTAKTDANTSGFGAILTNRMAQALSRYQHQVNQWNK